MNFPEGTEMPLREPLFDVSRSRRFRKRLPRSPECSPTAHRPRPHALLAHVAERHRNRWCDRSGHYRSSASAMRPASVIRMRETSTARRPPCMCSVCVVASPVRTNSVMSFVVKPCASSTASVSHQCSGPAVRGAAAIGAALGRHISGLPSNTTSTHLVRTKRAIISCLIRFPLQHAHAARLRF